MAARIAQVYGPMAPVNDLLQDSVPGGFLYDLVYIPGAAQGNALRNRAEQEAALAQTQDEHNDALNKYIDMLQYPPEIRKMMGQQIEKNLAKWNPNEDKKPRRPLTPSSSVVSELKILPNNHIGVRFGNNPKVYEYDGGQTLQDASRAVLELINSSSLGKAVNTKIPGSWGSRHAI